MSSEGMKVPEDLVAQYERAKLLAENGGYLQSEGLAVIPLIERIMILEHELERPRIHRARNEALELALAVERKTIAALTVERDRMREALALLEKYAPLSGDMALMIRASQSGGQAAHERANKLVEFYSHLDEAHDAARAALSEAPK